MRRSLLTALILGLALVSCRDLPTPSQPSQAVPSSQPSRDVTGPQVPPDTLPLYQPLSVTSEDPPGSALRASLDATGTLRPGQLIVITGTLEPVWPISNVQANLWAPEVEYTRLTGTGDDYRVPMGSNIPSFAAATTTGAVTEIITIRGTIMIEAPGVYEVLLTATGELDRDHPYVNDTIRESLWIYVFENGSSTSKEFDPSRIPQGFRREPGPARALPSNDHPIAGLREMGFVASSVSAYIYYNDPSAIAVHGSIVELREYAYEGGPFIGSDDQITDSNGIATFTCLTGVNNYVELIVTPGNAELHTSSTSTNDTIPGWCDDVSPQTFNANVGGRGHIFLNYAHDIIPTVDAAFSASVPNLWVTLGSGCSYSASLHRIQLSTDCTWGSAGLRIQSHEYGHALHEKGLGGNEGSGQCPSPHYLRQHTNPECAFSEGFATFVAMATGFWTTLDDNWYIDQHCLSYNSSHECTSWGTEDIHYSTEGAVTAFLYDVYDGAGESFDSVSVSLAHIGQIVSTCTVGGSRPSNIWRLSHCIQREVDGYGGHSGGFPGSAPSTYSVTSGHSVTGSQVRALWRWHFFNDSQFDPLVIGPIGGPTEVRSTEQCFWNLPYSGGKQPITHSWSGVVSSSLPYAYGYVSLSGWLKVTVTSAWPDTQQQRDSLWVVVDSGAPDCEL